MIDPVSRVSLRESVAKEALGEEATDGLNFGSYLEKSVSEVNTLLKTADETNIDVAIGKAENLHSAMIALEKADTALKLLVQVRNKAIEAYNEVMKMGV